jgi:hypothetical protein
VARVKTDVPRLALPLLDCSPILDGNEPVRRSLLEEEAILAAHRAIPPPLIR